MSTKTSSKVNAILEKDSNKFAKFGRVKDAYRYFMDNNKIAGLSYDNFHYYYTKFFKAVPVTAKKKKVVGKVVLEETTFIESEEVEIKIFNPRKEKVDEEIFQGLMTGKPIDGIVSKKGGWMPGTTWVMSGGPGTGKSTIAFDTLYSVSLANPKDENMAFSSEMGKIDLQSELDEKKWMMDVKHVLLQDYEPEQYKAIIRKVILHGYNFLVIDSFQDIVEKLNAFCYMSKNEATSFLFSLFKEANEGKTFTGKHSCILVIQQVTKGGIFVGTNALKHNTTGFIELTLEDNFERYLCFSKNRRNGSVIMRKLYYCLNDQSEIEYNITRYEEEIKRELLMKDERKRLEESKNTFDALFLNKTQD